MHNKAVQRRPALQHHQQPPEHTHVRLRAILFLTSHHCAKAITVNTLLVKIAGNGKCYDELAFCRKYVKVMCNINSAFFFTVFANQITIKFTCNWIIFQHVFRPYNTL